MRGLLERAVRTSRGLRTRIVLLMSIALLPLGLISVSHTISLTQESERLRKDALYQGTLRYAEAIRADVSEAAGAARGLRQVALTRADDLAACRAELAGLILENPQFSFAGISGLDGNMDCVSRGEALDLSQDLRFAQMVAAPRRMVTLISDGRASGVPELVVSMPVTRDGVFEGVVEVSVPVLQTGVTLQQSDGFEKFSAALVASGIEAPVGPIGRTSAPVFPAGRTASDLVDSMPAGFVANDSAGLARIFAVVPIAGDQIGILGSVPVVPTGFLSWVGVTYDGVVFPVLMWIASLAVVVFGTNRLVLRHVRKLQSAMRQFALGERDGEGLNLEDAPAELDDAARSFNRMALVLRETEARVQRDLEEKELLLREVHHRVKNNLQFIASIINIQMRRVESEEARGLLSGLQKRIRGLATMHRTLYQSTDLASLDAAELLGVMVADMGRITQDGDNAPMIEQDLNPLIMDPDRAAPLALLFAEALTNAVKHGGTAPGRAPIRVALRIVEEGRAEMIVENPIRPEGEDTEADARTGSGLGTRLMVAFVAQIDGEAEQSAENGTYRYRVVFPVSTPIAAAETPGKAQDAA